MPRTITRRPVKPAPAEEAYESPDYVADDSDDDDEEETTRPASKAGSGWGAYKKKRAESGEYPDDFRPDKERTVIKFLDDEPFAVYREHWIERPGKKSWTCIEDDCPLCEIGDTPTVYAAFNVVVMDENPSLNVWRVRPRVASTLENLAEDKTTGPLTKHYYAVSRTGKGSKSVTNVNPIKSRDLAEDFQMEPLTSEELREFDGSRYDASVIQYHTRKQLRELVNEVSDDSDDD